MKYGVILKISQRQLLARIKQTGIAALGVTFGISVFIGMVAFMTGVNKMLDDLMLSSVPHVRLFNDVEIERLPILNHTPEFKSALNIVHHAKPKEERTHLRNSLPILNSLRQDERVAGLAPRVTTQVFYQYGASDINGIVVGVDIVEEDKLFDLGEKMIAGQHVDLLTLNDGIIVGKGLANRLGVGIDDRVVVVTSKGVIFQLIVVGVFQTGVAGIDDVQSYVTLRTAQRILQKRAEFITDINLKVQDLGQASNLAKEYARRFDVDAIDYDTANAQIKVSYEIRNAITYSVSIALLIVAGFGIYNILNMLIYEKMDDIAILKATGFSGREVKMVFISQALIIGCVGGILGLGLGYLISLGISQVPFESDALPNMKTMPVNFAAEFYWIGIGFALITTFLAGFLPAQKASKVDPVEIIRGK